MSHHSEPLPLAPTAVHPAMLGATVPDIPLLTDTGEATSLSAAVVGEPTVLVFYRGGW